MPTVSRAVAAMTRPRPGWPSSRISAPNPSATAPTNPICIAQNRFSNPLPKKATISAMTAPAQGTGGPPGEDVDLEHDDDMEEGKECQVGHVRGQAQGPEHQPVDDGRDPEPVLIERLEKAVEADRALRHDRPLVGEERQPAAEPEQGGEGHDRATTTTASGRSGRRDCDASDAAAVLIGRVSSERCGRTIARRSRRRPRPDGPVAYADAAPSATARSGAPAPAPRATSIPATGSRRA